MKLLMIVLFSICLSANLVYADRLGSTRGQGLVEKSHHVDVYIKDGIARLRVRRSFYNPGKRHEQAELTLHLPRGAAATGLRIKAGRKWYAGELMEAEKAAALYEELTGIGPHAPKDPALLSWSWVDELFLSVFPIAPKKTSFVEYTLTMPTQYSAGRYLISYPRLGKPRTSDQIEAGDNQLSVPTITVHGHKNIFVDGKKARKKHRLGDVKRASILNKYDYTDAFRYAVLPLKIKEAHGVKNVVLTVDIDHTWSGDVALDLISPDGNVIRIDDGDWQGEDENKKSIVYTLEDITKTKGTWTLVAWDTYPNIDSGQITKWSLSFGKGKKREVVEFSRPQPVPNSGNSAIAQISIPARIRGKIDFRYAKVDLIKDKNFLSYELNLAKRISKLPDELHLSFLVDASHSMDESKIESARLLIREILALVPNARVSLVLFDRKARLWGAKIWLARELHRALKTLTFKTQNGSHLDRAIDFAEKRARNKTGTHEMILITDARLRPSWNTLDVAKSISVKKNAPLHVVQLENSSDVFERGDDLPLFPIAKKRGGVAMRVGSLENYRRSKLKDKALYLLRPTWIENVKVNDQELESLKEGTGIRDYEFQSKAPQAFHFSGELWSTPIRKKVPASLSNSKALGAFVFSLDRFEALTEKEQLKMAMWANVVSPVTSFLAVEPGVRPSIVGLGLSTMGTGSGHGAAGMRLNGRGALKRVNLYPLLEPVFSKCASVRTTAQSIFVDLTSHEIVDVRPGKHANKKATQCLTEAIWGVDLPKLSNFRKTDTFEIIVPKIVK